MSAFFTVFITVFLAELGDKTQIATALYAAEGERSPWLVFFASAAALVTSTALATLLGGVAREFVSGQLIKIIAGAGFILVGAFVLWTALKPT